MLQHYESRLRRQWLFFWNESKQAIPILFCVFLDVMPHFINLYYVHFFRWWENGLDKTVSCTKRPMFLIQYNIRTLLVPIISAILLKLNPLRYKVNAINLPFTPYFTLASSDVKWYPQSLHRYLCLQFIFPAFVFFSDWHLLQLIFSILITWIVITDTFYTLLLPLSMFL